MGNSITTKTFFDFPKYQVKKKLHHLFCFFMVIRNALNIQIFYFDSFRSLKNSESGGRIMVDFSLKITLYASMDLIKL